MSLMKLKKKGKDHGNNHGLLKQRKASLKYSNIYWDIHNDSLQYSDKIIRELRLLLQELSSKPIYIGRYIEKMDLYVRTILKGRFLLYFQVKEETIEKQHFRGSKQESIEI